MSWEKITFGELYKAPSRNGIYKEKSSHGAGVKIVNMGEIFAYDFIGEQDMQRIEMTANEMLLSGLEENDLLFARRSLVESGAGKASIVSGLVEPTTFESSIIRVRLNKELCYPLFYLYWMRSLAGREAIGAIVTGINVKGIRGSDLKNIKVDYPSIKVQKRVSKILKKYDDLIENNQKQIKLLEEAAQRLYKEWFVDLRFPGHETTPIINGIPEGWKKAPLGDLIDYEIGGGWGEELPTEKCDQPAYVIRGTDLYDVTHGNAKSIPYRYHAQNNLNSRKLQDGDIVFEVSGGSKNEGVARTALVTKSLVDFLGEDVICASFCKLIRFKNKSAAKYMYDMFQYLRNSGETVKYDKRSASSIVNYRWKDFLEQQFVFIPSTDVLAQYNALAENMQKIIVNKAQIIEQAKQARDRLLPKLMSGELEV